MMKRFKFSSQQGQSMTEFIVIVALVGIAAVGVYLFLGWGLREKVASNVQELAGEDGSTMALHASASGFAAEDLARKNKGLDNYMLER